jgi:hypothetical protein
MAEGFAPGCLNIPIDHRLRALLQPHLAKIGKHVDLFEQYGNSLQDAGKAITLQEIQFGRKLAMPRTKGGVVILLERPPKHQRYDGDFDHVVQQCATLRAIDDVLRNICGSSLEETSCFDAFPFQNGVRGDNDFEAYEVFKEMMKEKKPEVVLCCYRSPDATLFDFISSIGVGKMHTRQFPLGGQFCTPVNAFHPSLAVNYNKSESCFRNLYILEALKAFHEIDGAWTDQDWMHELRSFCAKRVDDLSKSRVVYSA